MICTAKMNKPAKTKKAMGMKPGFAIVSWQERIYRIIPVRPIQPAYLPEAAP